MSTARIDAHHHLWRYSHDEYPWMAESMQVLRRHFLIPELENAVRGAQVAGTVVVQARQTLEETRWLLDLAAKHEIIRGVVGWVPLINGGINEHIAAFSSNQRLVGVRHVLHDETDDHYMLRADFNRGVARLKQHNLCYDLLIFERHLPQTIEFIDRHPQQIFILDHIAKPRIKAGILSPWREQIRELAKRENVYCKLSGIVTEADWERWAPHDLQPYFDVVLEAFGPKRLMYGSDWPVVLLSCPYSEWLGSVAQLVSHLSADEQGRIFADTAREAYQLR